MCAYCFIADHQFKFDPPWDWTKQISPIIQPNILPTVPQPVPVGDLSLIPKPVDPNKPIIPWSLDRLKEFLRILKEVKALEDQLGCPCEPNKADYISLIEKRIAQLESDYKNLEENKE